MKRLDALGPSGAKRAVTELLAYYQIQHEDRQEREWKSAMERKHGRRDR